MSARATSSAFMACGVLTLALFTLPAHSAEPEPEIRTYIVQPGDSVWSIAAEFYGSGDRYPVIYRYNDFAARPPFLLMPGQALRLPVLGVGPEAEVSWLLKDVRAKPPRSLDWLEARERMGLWRLYRVTTGDESAAQIVFDDLTDLRLRENALLVIYGASATAARTSRRSKHEVMLEEGTLQGGLAALDAGGAPTTPLVVRTPSGEVDLLARLAQVQAEITASIVSVFDGRATVKAQGAAVEVPSGQGTVVKKGKKPEAARPLPSAPAWSDGNRPALVAVVGDIGTRGSWEAAWQPAERAATYRVELAADEAFKQVLFDAEVGSGVARLRLADLEPGRYYARIGTRDADKLESRPGEVRLIEVVPLTPARAFAKGEDGIFESAGFAALKVHPLFQERVRCSIDGGPEQSGGELLRLGTPGLHEIRIRSGATEVALPFRVLAVSAHFDVRGEPLGRASGQPVVVNTRIVDERGREVELPDLVVETSTGQVLDLRRTSDGHVASLPAIAAHGPARIAIRARWAGGELGTREIAVAPEPVAAERPRETIALVPHRVTRASPGELVTARPETRMALDVAIADVSEGPGALSLSLVGELGLGDLGLTAALVAQDLRLEQGDGPQAKVQDLALQVRHAFELGAIVLSPYLRLAVPVGAGHEPRRLGIEPGALFSLPLGDVQIDARLALLYATDLGANDGLVGSALLALSWRPTHALSLGVSGETLGDFADGGARYIVGLGLGVFIGDLRLGASFGVGLGDEARRTDGAFLGRLVIDVGVPR